MRQGLFMIDGMLRPYEIAVERLREKLASIPNIDVEQAIEEIFERHAHSPLGLEEVYQEWRHARKLRTFGERYSGTFDQSFKGQLQEAAEIIARKMKTCAFCGVESTFNNPVRICPACRCPSCTKCRLALSVHSDPLTGEVIEACRHANPSRRIDL